MRVSLVLLALTAVATTLVPAASAADSICSAETCYITGGSKKCDRTKTDCPPCLYKRFLSFSYQCYYLDDSGKCPEDTTLCAASSDSGSGSGSATTPEPTTKTPKPTKTKKPSPSTAPPNGSNSGAGSDVGSRSGSGPTTQKPATTKPTTTTPTTTKPVATPALTPNVTAEAQATTTPTSAQSQKVESSGSKVPLIVGIIGGVVAVIVVIAFFVWKRRRDEDDDSDDEDFRFNPPKATTRAVVGGGGAAGAAAGASAGTGAAGRGPNSVATTASYANSDPVRLQTSPGDVAAGAAGAQYGGGARYGGGANQYSSAGSANQYGQYGGANDYGSPSTIDGSSRNMFASGGGLPAYDDRDSLSGSQSSSNDDRDVWGNQQNARAAPMGYTTTAAAATTLPAQEPVYQREKRTHSNVSVEF